MVSSPDVQTNSGAQPALPLPQPQPRPAIRPSQRFVYTLDGLMLTVSTRMLSLLAVLGAIGIFAFCIWDPNPVRAWTAGGYAVTVLWPTIWLYLKRET